MAKKKQSETQENNSKNEAIELAIATLSKQFGAGTIMTGTSETVPGVEFFSSGIPSVDKALGGGYPKGRIVELYGEESSAKSTLALHAITEVQKNGNVAAYVDAEHAFDPHYATNLGVNMPNLLMSQPDSGEQALEIVEALVRTGAVSLIVIDSVAALTPQKELEGDMGDSNMGLHARLMSQAMRKLAGIVSKTGTTLIFINQIRQKMVMFGNPNTVTGGNALKFYSSQRIETKRKDAIKLGDEVIGNKVKLKVTKNKVAPPFKETEFSVFYGKGVSANADLLNLALQEGLVEKNGSWFSYKENKIGQGENQVLAYFEEHPDLVEELKCGLLQTN